MQGATGKDHYLSLFERFERNGAGQSPGWLRKMRKEAISSFAALGFPTTREENWRYTSVEPIVKLPVTRDGTEAIPIAEDAVSPLAFTDPAYNRLVFVNGIYSPELSLLRRVPDDVCIESLAEVLRNDARKLEPYLARYAGYEQQPFVALNTAFIEDGAFVRIPRGRVLEEPLYLVFVSASDGAPVVSYPRNLIVLEGQSQAQIVETYVGLGAASYFANAVTEVVAEEDATVDHYRLQRERDGGFHVATLEAHLGRDCNLTAHSIVLGGSLVRNDVRVVLNGEGSECALNGLYMAAGAQHVDNHTEIEHVAPRASSRELYKGILAEKARGVFNGKILVHKGAQKTDARQANKNLLLSGDAVVNTKPQLEIYADDVKCTHGSTIGQLDRDALFYLRSRGLDADAAASLLTYAFASDIVNRIQVGAIRARLDRYLLKQLEKH